MPSIQKDDHQYQNFACRFSETLATTRKGAKECINLPALDIPGRRIYGKEQRHD
jgi:hypothetical protein